MSRRLSEQDKAERAAKLRQWTSDWRTWPVWVLDLWWEQRIDGRRQNRYGYTAP
jgi:hypothetical protein